MEAHQPPGRSGASKCSSGSSMALAAPSAGGEGIDTDSAVATENPTSGTRVLLSRPPPGVPPRLTPNAPRDHRETRAPGTQPRERLESGALGIGSTNRPARRVRGRAAESARRCRMRAALEAVRTRARTDDRIVRDAKDAPPSEDATAAAISTRPAALDPRASVRRAPAIKSRRNAVSLGAERSREAGITSMPSGDSKRASRRRIRPSRRRAEPHAAGASSRQPLRQPSPCQ